MPHFIVECTENIRRRSPTLPELFASVNTALAATGIFPLGEYVAGCTGSIPAKWLMASTITPSCI